MTQRSGITAQTPALTHIAGVPIEEFGDTMRIEGIVVGDGHKSKIFILPGESIRVDVWIMTQMNILMMSIDQALAWLKQSDDPTQPEYSDDKNKILKAIVRKSSRQVDQNVAWACYTRDGYECMYCGATKVPLTYDHFVAQAYGGKTTIENGISACRPCNKTKGHMTVSEWVSYMQEKGFKYADRYKAKSS